MRILFLEATDSTQRVAIEWVQRGVREWDAVCADHQTAGRGRRGTHWHDEPGMSLLVSLVLWEVLLPDPPGLLGIMTALATAETLEQCFPPLKIRLKYPNDLILQGRKLGGILVEIADSVAVVGVGVNLAQREFPKPLDEIAVSVWQGLQGQGHWDEGLVSREGRARLIEGIGARLHELTVQTAQYGLPMLYALWQARDETSGRPYQVLDVPGQPVGIALQVEPDFRLRLRLPDGREICTYLVQSITR